MTQAIKNVVKNWYDWLEAESSSEPTLQLPSDRSAVKHVDPFDPIQAQLVEPIMAKFKQEHPLPFKCLCLYMKDTGDSVTVEQKARKLSMGHRQFRNTCRLSYIQIGIMLRENEISLQP